VDLISECLIQFLANWITSHHNFGKFVGRKKQAPHRVRIRPEREAGCPIQDGCSKRFKFLKHFIAAEKRYSVVGLVSVDTLEEAIPEAMIRICLLGRVQQEERNAISWI